MCLASVLLVSVILCYSAVGWPIRPTAGSRSWLSVCSSPWVSSSCVLLYGEALELDGDRISPFPLPSESAWFGRQTTSWEIFKSYHPTILWNPSYIYNLYCHLSFLYTISYTFKSHLTIVSFIREWSRNKNSSPIDFCTSNARRTFSIQLHNLVFTCLSIMHNKMRSLIL